MTTADLDLTFPPIVPPPEVPAIAATTAVTHPAPKMLTVAEFVKAQFASHEPTVTMLAAKHKADRVVIGTGKGIAEGAKSLTAAKAIRAELREQGRFAVQRALDALKKELNGAKGVAENEAARLIAIVEPVEKVYDDAIKAEEKRIEDERQAELERQRIRREGFQQAIRQILEFQRHAAGLPAERIARGLEKLELMEFNPEHWAEFLTEAKQAHAETVEALRKMHAEAVRLEALEAENARLRAEALKNASEMLAAMPEAIASGAIEPEDGARLTETVSKAAAELVIKGAKAPRHDPDTGELLGDDERLVPESITTVGAQVQAEMARVAAEVQAVNEAAQQATLAVLEPVAHDLPAIKLGDINAAIGKGFTMTSEFAEQVLNVPGERIKAAYLYTAAGRRALLEALVQRINAIK